MKTRIYFALNGLWVSKLGRAALITALLLSVGVITVLAADNFVGGWNIDGIVPDCNPEAAGCDIEVFSDPFGSVDELGPVNSNETKLGVIHTAPLPMLSYTNPNAQVDLRAAWLGTKEDANKDLWLYFAWERDSSNGSGVIMFEFQQSEPSAACDYNFTSEWTAEDLIAACNPWANRQPGDFIIVWDQGGKKINLIVRTWKYNDTNPTNGAWDGNAAEPLYLDLGTALDATVSAAAYSSNRYYGEATVNLTDTIFAATPTSCTTFGNVIPGTVTGNSDTADYKDTILADFSGQIYISNCGSIKVIKKTNPVGLEGSFPYTIDQADDGAIRYSGDFMYVQTGTLSIDGDSDTWNNLKCDTDYQLTEGSVAPAFAMSSIVCKVNGDSNTITSGGTFPVRASKITECTITNEQQKGSLIVKKVVINDDGGAKIATDFSFQVDGGTPIGFLQDGEDTLKGKNTVTNLDTDTYNVTEPAVVGYKTTYENCSNVLVPAGGSATCTITNNDVAPTLTLKKTVVNNNGGNLTQADFPSFVDDVAQAWDVATEVTANIKHSASETPHAGYTPSVWGGDCAADGTITLLPGDNKTCTITNNDIAPTLKLVKTVVNDNGGLLTQADFPSFVDGKAQAWDVATEVTANVVHTASETPHAGYTPSVWGGDCAADGTITLLPGDNKTCTITNDDIAPTLKLVKTVVNDNGGNQTQADFPSFVDGTAQAWDVATAVTANVQHTASETPNAGYTASAWGGDCAADGKITLLPGDNKTCTITNDDKKAQPTGATTMSWQIADTLTITGIRTGAPNASSATVTFKLFSDASCETQVGADSKDATIVSGVADSAYFTVGVGTYYWQAVYSGDQYNVGFTTKCGYEITTIGQTIGPDWK